MGLQMIESCPDFSVAPGESKPVLSCSAILLVMPDA